MSGVRGQEPIPYEYYDAACDERDALRAENQRLKSEAEDMVLAAAYYERVVLHEAAAAENQRLRDALEQIATEWEGNLGTGQMLSEFAREALDGAAK